MPSRPPECPSGGRIAPGIRLRLDGFAAANSAMTWKVFAGADPLLWRDHVLERMNDPEVLVLFNLKGVDVWATDWKLLQISQNEEWWPQTEWLKDGQRLPDPFV